MLQLQINKGSKSNSHMQQFEQSIINKKGIRDMTNDKEAGKGISK